MKNFDYKNLFLENLKTGINLFTGAGFSILPNPEGKKLPLASELVDELKKKFDISSSNADLELISMQIKNINPKGFDAFLRQRYHVDSYNTLYNALNKINIKNYITTNIDNLFQSIIEKNKNKYVNSIVNGTARNHGVGIDYLPLHGDITDINSNLYFGKLELSMASAQNKDLFRVMEAALIKYPTLFCGYGFHDSSVMNSIGEIMQKQKHRIWILFKDENESDIFRQMGFNTIVSGTEELLQFISDNLPNAEENCNKSDSSDSLGSVWNQYRIPTQNNLKINIDVRDYFNKGIMGWNIIFNKHPYKTTQLLKVLDKYIECKNLIIVGTPQCGKTTLLRQIALESNKEWFYIENLNEAEANKLSNCVKRKINVLIDNCSLDTKAFKILAENSFVKLIGATDEYAYESSKHIMENTEYSVIQFADLTEDESRKIYAHIPDAIKKDEFTYSNVNKEKYSFLEFNADNIRDFITEEKILKFIGSLRDEQVREVLFLTTYLTQNHSMLSMDVLFYYFKMPLKNLFEITRRVNEALSEVDEVIDRDMLDEDYYVLRSNLFLRYMHQIAIRKFPKEYGKVIKKVIIDVPRGAIFNYSVFHRSSFDAEVFFKLYGNNDEKLYDQIIQFDDSAYTFQQKALYETKRRNYANAFSLIEKASLKMPKNLSIQNTKAIITFEANKDSDQEDAKNQREKAMRILEYCIQSDKRKVYHIQKYAEFALFENTQFGDNRYIKNAQKWITDLMSEPIVSSRTKKLDSKLRLLN